MAEEYIARDIDCIGLIKIMLYEINKKRKVHFLNSSYITQKTPLEIAMVFFHIPNLFSSFLLGKSLTLFYITLQINVVFI
ncbi:MAG TPA: hypothetical protein VL201_04335 [Patescibacteria group bacterium]|jgi:hypothetical protein|nr:hypothetical protein [Patescibacteria group bacterium]